VITSPIQPVNTGSIVRNALFRYFAELRTIARSVATQRSEQPVAPLELSTAATCFAEFADVSDIGLLAAEPRTYILDLMRNPGARTTKTMASLLMVARAAEHIRTTGERLLVLTPTSGNKGTALRDAVARAYRTGLVTPDGLRMVTLVPEVSRGKLRHSPLDEDKGLCAANPVAVARVEQAAHVKQLSSAVVEHHAAEIRRTTGFRLWYTLDLDNYRIADAARAFAEAELLPITEESRPRVHVHAVSSAFGLLGYHLGHRFLTAGLSGLPVPARHPGFFLVQQLATPDMVTSLLDRAVPDYCFDARLGAWCQQGAPGFPATTDDPREVIDATFYTKAPPTSAQINGIIERHGGGGVVVSKRECLERFDRIRELAARAGIAICTDPAQIREWALVMALAGVLVGRERGLLDADTDVVVHASGYYTDDVLPPMRTEHLVHTDTVDDLARVVVAAAHA